MIVSHYLATYKTFLFRHRVLEQAISVALRKSQRLLSLLNMFLFIADTSHDKISRDKAAFGVRDNVFVALKEAYPGTWWGNQKNNIVNWSDEKDLKLNIKHQLLFGGIILKHLVDQILAVQLYFLLKYFFKFQKQIYVENVSLRKE